MALYWSKIVDSSRSPSLQSIERASSAVIFLSYVLSCKKLHISVQLINSFQKTYGSWSCDKEELSIRLEARQKVQSSENFLFSGKKLRGVFLYVLANHAQTVHWSIQDRELSNDVGLSNSGKEKLMFTPFWGGPKPGCADSVRAGIIKSQNFFVSGPILVKFHIWTRLIKSFRRTFWTWWCSKEKLHFTPVHTLRQLKWDEMRFPHFGGSQSFEWGTVRKLNTAFLEVGKIWRSCDLRSGSCRRL